MKEMQKAQEIIDPDSDKTIEIVNDLMVYKTILEKIPENPDI